MNKSIHTVDLVIVLIYFVVLLFVGFFHKKQKPPNDVDYLLAGRKLTLIPFVATLVATWYGGILGVGEFTFKHGLSNWVVLGFPYYVFALLFAIFLAERIRKDELVSIPDRFYSHFGKGAGILSAIFVMILVSPAPYILSVGIIIHFLFGISSFTSILIATVFSLIYIYRGGFRSVIRTDILQFSLMFIGFVLLLILSVKQFGGFSYLKTNLPPLHLTWHGGNSTQYILVWFFIALWTFVDPGFFQRTSAAKSGKTAMKGIFLSIGFWFLFDFLTLSTGLYARAVLPTLPEPMLALPTLGKNILPPIILGLFFAGLLSTIMSTVDSFGFLSAQTFGRDLIWRWKPKTGSEIRWTQVGLVITGIFSLFLALLLPSVVKLWYGIGSVMIPGLLIPFLCTFFCQRRYPLMVWMMFLPAFLSFIWFVVGRLSEIHQYPFNIEPFYPGLILSLILFVVFSSDIGGDPQKQSAQED